MTAGAPVLCVAFMVSLILIAHSVVALPSSPRVAAAPYDVIVYGANAAGVLASVASARRGARTALLCQAWPDCFDAGGKRVGGLTTGGLGTTDSCHQSANEPYDLCQLAITGGLAKEFYAASASHYGCRNCTALYGCTGCNESLAGPQMPYNVEPHVAHEVLMAMIGAESSKLDVIYEAQVEKVVTEGSSLQEIILDDGRSFKGKVFIDSSYEGDLMARAGVDYTIGRESPTKYNETLNGRLRGDARNDNEFHDLVDPYLVLPNGTKVVLPGVMSAEDASSSAGKPGDADSHVQAYNFRVCTSKAADRIPWPKPDEYHAEDYELLVRTPYAWRELPSCNTAPIPNQKYDTNNCGSVSSDLITADYTNQTWRSLTSWAYPDADYATRREIWRVHQRWQQVRLKCVCVWSGRSCTWALFLIHLFFRFSLPHSPEFFSQGLYWTLAHDERIPQSVREEMGTWGLCANEFNATKGWPPSLYIREARRMVGARVLTQADVRVTASVDIGVASLGLAAHAEDSHNNQRFACLGGKSEPPCYGDGPHSANSSTSFVWNEGDYHSVFSAHVYQLPTYLVLPKREQASNLLVVSAPSASHVAFSTFRMEPAFMILGNRFVWSACVCGVEEAARGLFSSSISSFSSRSLTQRWCVGGPCRRERVFF